MNHAKKRKKKKILGDSWSFQDKVDNEISEKISVEIVPLTTIIKLN